MKNQKQVEIEGYFRSCRKLNKLYITGYIRNIKIIIILVRKLAFKTIQCAMMIPLRIAVSFYHLVCLVNNAYCYLLICMFYKEVNEL